MSSRSIGFLYTNANISTYFLDLWPSYLRKGKLFRWWGLAFRQVWLDTARSAIVIQDWRFFNENLQRTLNAIQQFHRCLCKVEGALFVLRLRVQLFWFPRIFRHEEGAPSIVFSGEWIYWYTAEARRRKYTILNEILSSSTLPFSYCGLNARLSERF